jgi:hypothetical protein
VLICEGYTIAPNPQKKRWGCYICYILTKFCAFAKDTRLHPTRKKDLFVSDLSDFGTLQKSKTPNDCIRFGVFFDQFLCFCEGYTIAPNPQKKRWGCLICLILTNFCALRRIHDCTQPAKKTFFVSVLPIFGTLQNSKTPNACIRLGLFFDQFLCLFSLDRIYILVIFYRFFVPKNHFYNPYSNIFAYDV